MSRGRKLFIVVITGQSDFAFVRAKNLKLPVAVEGSREKTKVAALVRIGHGANRIARQLAQCQTAATIKANPNTTPRVISITDGLLLVAAYLSLPSTVRLRVETWALQSMMGLLARLLTARGN
mgnify:CR=1 FL=1